jgi:hypothetical protein
VRRLLIVLAVIAGGCRIDADYGGTSYRCADGVCPAGHACRLGTCVPGDGTDGGGDAPTGLVDARPDAPAGPVDAPGAVDARPDAPVASVDAAVDAGGPCVEYCGDGVTCDGGPDPACPPNDRPAGAIDVSAGGTFTATLDFAHDDAEGACSEPRGRDVFYELTLPAPEVVYLATFGSGFDTVLHVHRGGCASPGMELACQDDACGTGGSQLALQLDAGDHCVVADENSPGEDPTLPLRLQVVRGGRPGRPIDPATSTYPGNTCGGANAWDPMCDTSDAPEVAYFGAACDGDTVTASTCDAGTNFDTILFTRGAAGAMGADLACNDDVSDFGGDCAAWYNASEVTGTASAHGLYWIIVEGFDTECGDYVLTLL